jgi:hypothetical protein
VDGDHDLGQTQPLPARMRELFGEKGMLMLQVSASMSTKSTAAPQ